ncbi:thiol-activated cytolysin family protein [Sphingobacterium deserti]|nr:thiol-activated cytolysin family protein [Sphingobacterium deserti]
MIKVVIFLKLYLAMLKKSIFFIIPFLTLFCSCEKNVESIDSIEDFIENLDGNVDNQFKDFSTPIQSWSAVNLRSYKSTLVRSSPDPNGCVTLSHSQSRTFDKLAVLNPNSEMMYIGSLLDGASMQNGDYTPFFLSPSYVRKPVTFSVSLQGSNGVVKKTIEPSLSNFRVSMQQILNADIVGEQPANFTFEIKQARSKSEIQMNIGVNLSFGSIFSSFANFNESTVSTKKYYLLKIYQKFFSADIDIPQNGDLFNKPMDFNGSLAPLYVSSIDYGRSAYFLLESSYDSVSVHKSLNTTFSYWKVGAGFNISGEDKQVLDELKISGTVIGGSSSDAATTIQGVEGFKNYVIKGGSLSGNSRGEIIAYRLRSAQNNSVFRTVIQGNYQTKECPQMIPNGVFVQNVTNGQVSVMFDGRLRHIQRHETLRGLFDLKIPQDLRNFTAEQLTNVPLGVGLGPDNGLIRTRNNNMIYFREGTSLRHVASSDVFQKYKFRVATIKDVPSIPAGHRVGAPLF